MDSMEQNKPLHEVKDQVKKKKRRKPTLKSVEKKETNDSQKKGTEHSESSAIVSAVGNLNNGDKATVSTITKRKRHKRKLTNEKQTTNITVNNNSHANDSSLKNSSESICNVNKLDNCPLVNKATISNNKNLQDDITKTLKDKLSMNPGNKTMSEVKHKNVKSVDKELGKQSTVEISKPKVVNSTVGTTSIIAKHIEAVGDKNREQIKAEREAKKLAKQAAKQKGKSDGIKPLNVTQSVPAQPTDVTDFIATTQILHKSNTDTSLAEKLEKLVIADDMTEQEINIIQPKVKVVPTKAERRAIQEAQRAAKAKAQAPVKTDSVKPTTVKSTPTSTIKPVQTLVKEKSLEPKEKSPQPISKKVPKAALHQVKLFSHLYIEKYPSETLVNHSSIHPAFVKLGVQFGSKNIVGSNSRSIAFLSAIKSLIGDYETPPQKEFSRGIEAQLQPCILFLQKCRPLAVSVTNAFKFVKWQISQLPQNESDAELKSRLLESIDIYIRDQIEKAAQAISITVQEKISNGDVILTYGCSSIVRHILEEAHRRQVDFRVVVVDARPLHEGQEMLRRLVPQGIRCTAVLINAAGFIMPEVTKVFLGAHALLANGYVMSRVGTAQIAMVAKSFNVPVLVCCETHKFSERVQTDAFVYNEIGDPDDLVFKPNTFENHQNDPLTNWIDVPQLTPLNLFFDITPPELVTAVVTELAILPCTSVPVILRIKPSEIGY